MKKTILTIVTLAFMGSSVANAQVGIGTTTPDAAAVLDLTSTTQGLLPPRMTAAQRDAIATPVQGLMVYCTNCGSNGEPQFYNGAAWVNLVGGTATVAAVPTPNVTSTTGRIWLDRNLGAAQVATISTDAASYGDLYQWGRGADGHEKRDSGITTGPSSSTNPGSNFLTGPSNWYTGPSPDDLWQGVNGINNPCPSGYRLPTEAEWDAERLSWGSNDADGAFASPLKLPVAGNRNYSFGSLSSAGTYGLYWSSTVSSPDSRFLNFNSSDALMGTSSRAYGSAVRCLKE